MLSHVPIFSSLDKDQIKVVIDEVTRWLDLAEEGDWMTLPDIAGRQGAAPRPGSWERALSPVGSIPSPPVDPGRRLSRHMVPVIRCSSDLGWEVGGLSTCSEF